MRYFKINSLIIFFFLFCFLACQQDKVAVTTDFSYSLAGDGKFNFKCLSSNVSSYAWSFGDSKTSSEASPSHTYGDNGSYTVTLTAVINGSSTVASKLLVINTIKGTAVFWVSTGAYGKVDVYIDGGIAGTITKYSTGPPPACGTSGFVTISRNADTYAWKALASGTGGLEGTVTILGNQCGSVEIF